MLSTMRSAIIARILLSGTTCPASAEAGLCNSARPRSSRSRSAPSPVLAQVPQHIFLANAPVRSCSRHQAQVDIVFLGNLPHQRRGADAFAVHAFGAATCGGANCAFGAGSCFGHQLPLAAGVETAARVSPACPA
jgi:hypothetical protein